MAEFASYTRSDAAQTVSGPIDAAPLAGDWINVKADTSGIVRAFVRATGGRLFVRIWGSGPGGPVAGDPVEWGEAEATPFVAGTALAAAGFCARFVLGQVETQLATNEKFGVLVIQSYTRFLDGSGRRAHFAREFFRRRDRAVAMAVACDDRRAVLAPLSDVDLAPLAGTWRNTCRDTAWWDTVILAAECGRSTIRPFGRGEPRDWGTAAVRGYRDNLGELAFEGVIDAGPVQTLMAANMNKELMVIAAYHRFAPDDGRGHCLIREFYYRDEDPAQDR